MSTSSARCATARRSFRDSPVNKGMDSSLASSIAVTPSVRWADRNAVERRLLLESDLSLDDDVLLEPLHGQHGPRGKALVAAQAPGLDGVAQPQLDLALRRHAELLEKLARREVEGLFVHQSGI